MSNRRRLKQRPRPPGPVEAAFRDALREGCPECGSRTVIGRYRDGGVWDFGLRCPASCRTHADPGLAHRIASDAAKRAGMAAGERLVYQGIDNSTGAVTGVVRAAG